MARARFIPSSLGPAIAVVLSCGPQGARVVEEDEGNRAVIEEPPRPPVREQPSEPTIVDYGPCVSTHNDGPDNARPRCVFGPEGWFRIWVPSEQVDALEIFVDGRQVLADPLEPVDDQAEGIGLWLDEHATMLEVGFPGHAERWALPLRAERAHHPYSTESIEHRLVPTFQEMHDLSRAHRFDEAYAVLALAEPLGSRSTRVQAMLAFHRGALKWRSGRLDAALASMRTASLHAIRAGEMDIAVAALSMYADLLAEQGYIHAAQMWSQRGRELADEHGSSCNVAATRRTTGWIQLLLRQQGWSNIDPTRDLERALAIYGPRGTCPDSSRTGGARLSLALLRLQAGDPAGARQILGKAKLSRMTPGERVLAIDVELQAQLALRHPPARIDRALRRLRRAVEDANTTNAQWHLALREGQVLEARGEHAAAIEAYREAETRVDGLAQLAAFGVGRSAIGTFHRESNDRLVDALLSQGRTSDALCVARQAEARRLHAASLPSTLPAKEHERLQGHADALREAQAQLDALLIEQRDASVQTLARVQARVRRQRLVREEQLAAILSITGQHARAPSCEDLHQPADGELLLGLFPNGDQWLLFARDEVETRAHAVELRDFDYDLPLVRARLSEILLRPVATQIEPAHRIRVHAVGQAQLIDVHLLPWKGEPLIASIPVAWGVDAVAPATTEEGPSDDVPRAVLVADPTGSLPEAEAEVQEAAEVLARVGWRVDEIAREDARPHVLQERMATATLLHYAGHAEHDELSDPGWWPPYPGGTPSWPASLRLVDDTGLATHEILARSGQVPRTVILSGCQTGALDAAASGTSLAVAFLMAGAQEVLATTEVTRDANARSVVRGVYAELEHGGVERWSLVDALARVEQRRVAAGEAGTGYRVWVR